MINFDAAFDRLIGNEGGYVDNPNDPGGETNWGISKRQYPDLDIKALTRDQAKAIYQRDYWDKAHASQLCPMMMFQMFDYAVNAGIDAATRTLQRALGVPADGVWGPITTEAAQQQSPTRQIVLFTAAKLQNYTRDPNWQSFGAGWVNRCAADLRYAAQDF